jgi:hypothetical protein
MRYARRFGGRGSLRSPYPYLGPGFSPDLCTQFCRREAVAQRPCRLSGKASLAGTNKIQAGSLCYFTPLPCRGGYAEALAGGFPYLARQSGEQSSIGFQPVSSVDYGWLAVWSPISDWLPACIVRTIKRCFPAILRFSELCIMIRALARVFRF